MKLWDQKLVKMRSELNITSVVKRIQDKADNIEVQDMMQQYEERVTQMERSFIQVIEGVEELNRQNHLHRHTMDQLAGVNYEVSIGKRNINCLSCSPERTVEEMQSRYNKEGSPAEKRRLERPGTSTNIGSRRALKPII